MLGRGQLIVLEAGVRLEHYIEAADPTLPALAYGVNVTMRLSTIAFCALIAGTVVLRLRPAAKARGVEPRLSALFGTFLASALVFFPRSDLPPPPAITSILPTLPANPL